MTEIKKIDEIDAKILEDLLVDGRKNFSEIAAETQVSADIVWQHYKRMEKEGIIVGATIQLNYAVLGYNASASFFIDVIPQEQRQVIDGLRKIPGIYDAYQWGSHSRLWAVSDMMRTEQIEPIKQVILRLPSVLRLNIEIWTGSRNTPENLSVLKSNKISNDTKRTEQAKNRITQIVAKIDETDMKLIEKLTVNSRRSLNSIGKELKISASTAIRRYNNLKCNGIIKPIIQINLEKIGYHAQACFRLKTDPQVSVDKVAEKIAKISDVRGILKTIGSYNLTIFTAIKNIEHLVSLENEISKIAGIKEIETPSLYHDPILPARREHMPTF